MWLHWNPVTGRFIATQAWQVIQMGITNSDPIRYQRNENKDAQWYLEISAMVLKTIISQAVDCVSMVQDGGFKGLHRNIPKLKVWHTINTCCFQTLYRHDLMICEVVNYIYVCPKYQFYAFFFHTENWIRTNSFSTLCSHQTSRMNPRTLYFATDLNRRDNLCSHKNGCICPQNSWKEQ